MESSPTNDTLLYISSKEVLNYVDEGQHLSSDFKTVGFTGGEPFLNKDIIPMLSGCLEKDLNVLVLTNAMKPLVNHYQELLILLNRFGPQLTLRISLDHHSSKGHDNERGEGSFKTAITNLKNLSKDGFNLAIAGRSLFDETFEEATNKYRKLFSENNISLQEGGLIIFPEMKLDDAKAPEITTKCWSILNFNPSSLMCASSRMVIKRKGADNPSIVACTLLPYDSFFDYGPDLATSFKPTYLKHIYCSQFCVLGGASCSG